MPKGDSQHCLNMLYSSNNACDTAPSFWEQQGQPIHAPDQLLNISRVRDKRLVGFGPSVRNFEYYK